MKIIISIMIVVLSIMQCGCGGLFLFSDISDVFNEWEPADSNVAIVTYRSNLLYNGRRIEYLKYLNEHYEAGREEMPGDHLICISNGNLYGIWDFWLQSSYDLFELNLETNEVRIITTQNYEKTAMETYPICHYYDNQIIIENGKNNISYNLHLKKLSEYSAADDQSPKPIFEISHKSDQVEVSKEGDKRIMDFNYLCDRNEYLSGLKKEMEEKPRRFYGEREKIIYFYDTNIINNKIIIFIGVRERDGEATMLVFQYDYNNDDFCYVYGEFFSESYPMIYAIPVNLTGATF